MLTFGSLFSGIGGIDLGLERAGMVCKFQVEIDPFCQKVLAKHWPEVPRFNDVQELSGSDLPPVDLLCGGFPCQPVSTAGRRKGITDSRWLWPHFARLVDEMGPRYVFVENVPGLLSKGGTEVLADLAEMGFDAEWGAISAANLGAPHIRERIFVVGYPNQSRLEGGDQRQSPGANPARSGDRPLLADPGGSGRRQEPRGEYGAQGSDARGTEKEAHQPQRRGQGSGEWLVADTDRFENGGLHRRRPNQGGTGQLAGGSKDVADPQGSSERTRLRPGGAGGEWGRRLGHSSITYRDFWAVEPDVGRVVDGFPGRVDRIRALGNAVVPQWAQLIGEMILDLEGRGLDFPDAVQELPATEVDVRQQAEDGQVVGKEIGQQEALF